MNVTDILALHPSAADVLGAYGLYCFDCAFGEMESLETGAKLHGLTDEDIENLIDDLKNLLRKHDKTSDALTITQKAAKALKTIARKEKKIGYLLRVTTDAEGKFCMEFRKQRRKEDKIFCHPDVPDVSLIASPATLRRIGGACVDLKNGRFTLDLPTKKECKNCDKNSCTCGKNN
jgi:hybrid cluster-associated redox disulfide protein